MAVLSPATALVWGAPEETPHTRLSPSLLRPLGALSLLDPAVPCRGECPAALGQAMQAAPCPSVPLLLRERQREELLAENASLPGKMCFLLRGLLWKEEQLFKCVERTFEHWSGHSSVEIIGPLH